MFDQDTNSQADSAAETQADVISQWKSEVQDFFSNEWGNLRDLIRRLEESDWDGIALETRDGQSAPRPFHSTIAQDIAATHRPTTPTVPVPSENTTPPIVARSLPVPSASADKVTPARQPDTAIENTRLADLAKRLESQLNRSGPDA
jgi:hypothetical protein